MYTYMIAVGNYISRTHAKNEDHVEDTDYTDMIFHIDTICFTVSCLEEIYEPLKKYNFGKPVTWVKHGSSYAELSRHFGLLRNLGDTESICHEIGYIIKDEVAEKFVVIYQIPNDPE